MKPETSATVNSAQRIKQRKIYLLPIGDIDSQVLTKLTVALTSIFNYPCEVHKPSGNIIESLNATYDKRRQQYYSPQLLSAIKKEKVPADAVRVLGIVDVDIYAEGLNFIFGQADMINKVAIISLYRLHPEYYGNQENQTLFLDRALKEAVHELGHTFGLGHCRNPSCVMYFSNSILDTDRKGPLFCTTCQKKLEKNIKDEN